MSNCTPGMTPAAIKYLLVLDDLCREGKGVRSVEIAARMNVSKPSAHSMLRISARRAWWKRSGTARCI